MPTIPISPVDAVFAGGGYPIEFLLLFDEELDARRLRSALRDLSRPFWPAFGAFEQGSIRSEPFDEARHFDELSVGETVDPRASIDELTDAVSPLVPRDMPGLVFLRVLRFEGGGGLLFRMSHLVGDGYSVFFLLATLASMARLPGWPLAARAFGWLARPKLRRDILLTYRGPSVPTPPPKDAGALRIEIERVPRAEVARRLVHSEGVSHNDLLAAMILRRHALEEPERFARTIRLSVPIDVRRHVPEYGRRFFGNGILLHQVDFDADDVRAGSAEALARELRASMPEVSASSYARFLATLSADLEAPVERPAYPYDPERGCLVTNISRLPIQHLDFGSGRPSRVLPLTIAENSAAILRDGDEYVLRRVRVRPRPAPAATPPGP